MIKVQGIKKKSTWSVVGMKDLCLWHYVRWDCCYYERHWRTRTVNFVVYLWTPLACDEFFATFVMIKVQELSSFFSTWTASAICATELCLQEVATTLWKLILIICYTDVWKLALIICYTDVWKLALIICYTDAWKLTDHMLPWCVKIPTNELFTIVYLLTLLTCGVCFTASGVIKVQDIHFSTWRAVSPGWKRCAYVKHQKSFESWQLCVTLVSWLRLQKSQVLYSAQRSVFHSLRGHWQAALT